MSSILLWMANELNAIWRAYIGSKHMSNHDGILSVMSFGSCPATTHESKGKGLHLHLMSMIMLDRHSIHFAGSILLIKKL